MNRARVARGIAITLLIASLQGAAAQGASPQAARAAKPASPPKTKAAADAAFHSLLDDYLRNYQGTRPGSSRLKRAVHFSRIRRNVFGDVGPVDVPAYQRKLQAIDRLTGRDPEAVFDLARSLQLHWEHVYGDLLPEMQNSRMKAGTQVGAMIGVTALGASLFFKPLAAPHYFKIIRHLYPLAGTAAGAGAGALVNHSGRFDGAVPPSPAHLMKLGVASHETDYRPETLYRDLISLTVSVGAGSIAYQALEGIRIAKWANTAATPLKVHPAVLAGSLLAGFVVEKGAEAGIDHFESQRLRSEFFRALKALDDAWLARDDLRSLNAAHALVESALKLNFYLNREFYEALRDFGQSTAEVARSYPTESKGFEARMNDLSRALSERLENHRRAKGGLPAIALDPPEAPEARRALDREWASELRAGRIAPQPQMLLLQTAALLRSLRKEYLEDSANFLETYVDHDRRLE